VTRVGVGYRYGLAHWIAAKSGAIECLELTTEASDRGGRGQLQVLRESTPLLIHTQRLSLGTPGPLDSTELAWFANLVREAKPLWISEHLGFRHTGEIDLRSPVPIALTDEALRCLVEHAREVVHMCRTPLLLENIAAPLQISGSLCEPEFLNRFCEQSECGVLLDLTALLVNSRNHGFDPSDWLSALDMKRIVQLHVGGCRHVEGRWEDTHDAPIDEELWTLAQGILAQGTVQAVILERDARFPPVTDLESELRRLKMLSAPGLARSVAH
jgi:uncharacterized protein